MNKINTNKANNFEPVSRATGRTDVKSADGTKQAGNVENKTLVSEDKMQFSGQVAEAGKLLDKLKELPDVREEKIGALRQQINAGEYNPSGEDIANAIFKDEIS